VVVENLCLRVQIPVEHFSADNNGRPGFGESHRDDHLDIERVRRVRQLQRKDELFPVLLPELQLAVWEEVKHFLDLLSPHVPQKLWVRLLVVHLSFKVIIIKNHLLIVKVCV